MLFLTAPAQHALAQWCPQAESLKIWWVIEGN